MVLSERSCMGVKDPNGCERPDGCKRPAVLSKKVLNGCERPGGCKRPVVLSEKVLHGCERPAVLSEKFCMVLETRGGIQKVMLPKRKHTIMFIT